MIVLDTNVISELMKPLPERTVVEWAWSLDGDVAITAMTLAELLAGVRRLPAGKRRDEIAQRIEQVVRPYRNTQAILPFDDQAAFHYAEILAARGAGGLPISTADAQIAAICRAQGAVCATRNIRDFVHTGVELIDPWSMRD